MFQKDKMCISHRKPRNVSHEKTQMQFMCRVCLTRSNTLMYNLSETSVLIEEKDMRLYIHNALQNITSSKVGIYIQFCDFFSSSISCLD